VVPVKRESRGGISPRGVHARHSHRDLCRFRRRYDSRHRPRLTTGLDRARALDSMHRLIAANGRETSRADNKAAVLLAFVGALLGAFITLTRVAGSEMPRSSRLFDLMWWSAVVLMLLATFCFVLALVPRRRDASERGSRGPVYFGDIPSDIDDQRLLRLFEDFVFAPEVSLSDSLRRTSGIVRAKYRWIENGAGLLLTALPWVAVTLHRV
jgi:hypothetical protein